MSCDDSTAVLETMNNVVPAFSNKLKALCPFRFNSQNATKVPVIHVKPPTPLSHRKHSFGEIERLFTRPKVDGSKKTTVTCNVTPVSQSNIALVSNMDLLDVPYKNGQKKRRNSLPSKHNEGFRVKLRPSHLSVEVKQRRSSCPNFRNGSKPHHCAENLKTNRTKKYSTEIPTLSTSCLGVQQHHCEDNTRKPNNFLDNGLNKSTPNILIAPPIQYNSKQNNNFLNLSPALQLSNVTRRFSNPSDFIKKNCEGFPILRRVKSTPDPKLPNATEDGKGLFFRTGVTMRRKANQDVSASSPEVSERKSDHRQSYPSMVISSIYDRLQNMVRRKSTPDVFICKSQESQENEKSFQISDNITLVLDQQAKILQGQGKVPTISRDQASIDQKN